MKLTIGERIRVSEILPEKSNYETIKTIKKLISDLEPSEKEAKKYNIRTEKDKGSGHSFIKWENKNGTEEVEIGEMAHDVITNALNKLEKENELTDRDYTLYEKFVLKK